ncbi:MAG: carboxylating nicotinate-nucleotide diphosphorylase [Planctomycetes bacterium]|nr:carboxylating nicotinate-nucleotide diphosphorylase [Planctomycetota bacterium]
MPAPTSIDEITSAVLAALREDMGSADIGSDNAAIGDLTTKGDLTTNAVIPAGRKARARMVSRENCIIAGLGVARRVFELLDPKLAVVFMSRDGDRVAPGQVVLEATGDARALLSGERVALNFVQRLSGIATMTRAFVEAAGPSVELLHTRKTTPGLRALEVGAVVAGGGGRHRFGLFDQMLIKENHFALSGASAGETVARARAAAGARVTVGAEAVDFEGAAAAVDAGADYVLLDNYTPQRLASEVPRLREHIARRGRNVKLEASGGITKDNILQFAKTGVDRISVGALTHSARAIDLALDVEAIS